jgi:hypothetical protein
MAGQRAGTGNPAYETSKAAQVSKQGTVFIRKPHSLCLLQFAEQISGDIDLAWRLKEVAPGREQMKV